MVRKILKLCKYKQISCRKLATTMGFGPNTIFGWDEHRPSVDKAKAVADYFGVTVDYLLKPDFLDQLSKLLDLNGMSVSKLADLAGIMPSRLDQILDGADPDMHEIKAISDVLEVDPTYFSEIEMKEDRPMVRDDEIEICQIIKGLNDEKLHTVLAVVRVLAAE